MNLLFIAIIFSDIAIIILGVLYIAYKTNH